jgi:uncharacterized membrane protein
MIVLSYLWILALIPLLVEKEDREVQWHAKHGLVLTVAELIFWIVATIVNMVLSAILPPVGCIIGLLLLIVALGFVVFHVLCMIKGTSGERLKVPGISDFTDRF